MQLSYLETGSNFTHPVFLQSKLKGRLDVSVTVHTKVAEAPSDKMVKSCSMKLKIFFYHIDYEGTERILDRYKIF